MDNIRMGLVGCGGMGTRHLYGLRELARTPFNNVELCALCDISRENAERAAGECKQLLGIVPEVFTDLEEMARSVSDLHAVDVVTDPSLHHDIVCRALDLGLHVLVEKPMGITVRACRRMVEAAERNGRKLSVAENYRRDPSARLARHLLDRGAIGRPYMALFHHLGAGRDIFITPWRHLKSRGGPLLDMGVHYADMIRYQLGDIEEVYGDAVLVEPVRRKPDTLRSPYTFYQDRFRTMPAEVPADAEDTSVAVFRMTSGVTVNWVVGMGGHGTHSGEHILGPEGSLRGFGTRGGSVALRRVPGGELSQEEILEGEEGFEIDPLTAHFFPSITSAGDGSVDWKLIALELYELARAILDDGPVEVDGTEGLKDVAAVYAILESSRANRPVRMDENPRIKAPAVAKMTADSLCFE